MLTEAVLDASAAAKLMRQEPESDALRSWIAEARPQRLVVPAVFTFEVRNIASRSVREGLMPDADEAIRRWAATMALVRETILDPAEEVRAAIAQGLSAQDAAYFVLASRERPLVTYDEKLAKAVRAKAGAKAVLSPT